MLTRYIGSESQATKDASLVEPAIIIMAKQLKCEAHGCQVIKEGDTIADCVAQLQLHQENAHRKPTPAPRGDEVVKQKPPKIDRPTIVENMSEDDWEVLGRRWEVFKAGTEIAGRESSQLLAGCEESLQQALFRQDKELHKKPEAEVMKAIKLLAVEKVALTSRRTQMLESLSQDPGERIQKFVSRIKGLANVCRWQEPGSCGVN